MWLYDCHKTINGDEQGRLVLRKQCGEVEEQKRSTPEEGSFLTDSLVGNYGLSGVEHGTDNELDHHKMNEKNT